MNYSNKAIAACFSLWQEYVDPMQVLTQEQFNNLSFAERLEIINKTFPESAT